MTQVLLPYSDFELVAKCLNNKHLNKIITEAKQVYTQNRYGFGGQGNPAPYRMWKGYEDALGYYIGCLYKEWQVRLINGKRGGNIYHKAGEYIVQDIDLSNGFEMPTWITNDAIFSSYRSVLLAKDFEWYSQFGWTETPDIPDIDKKGVEHFHYNYGF